MNLNVKLGQNLAGCGSETTRRHKMKKLLAGISPVSKEIQQKTVEEYSALYRKGKVYGGTQTAHKQVKRESPSFKKKSAGISTRISRISRISRSPEHCVRGNASTHVA